MVGSSDSGILNNHPRVWIDHLAVSQFTLLANTRKGNKPDFHGAAKPEEAKQLYDYFFSKLQNLYSAEKVKDGVFQAMMEVGLVNDGPVGVDYRSDNGAVAVVNESLNKRLMVSR